MKLKLTERISYALGDVGLNFISFFKNFFLLYFLTDCLELNSVIAGGVIMACTIWDAINDPMMGVLCDRTRTRWGVYRPWMLGGAIPYGVFFILLFFCPVSASQTFKGIWVFVTFCCVGMANTAFMIPYSTMSNVMTTDSQERIILGTFRDYGAKAAGFLVSTFGSVIIIYFGGGELNYRGHQITVIFVSIIAVACLLLCTSGIKERVVPAKVIPFKKQLASLKGNTPFVVAIIMTILLTLTPAILNSFVVYYVIHYLGNPDLISPLMMTIMVTPFISMLFIPTLVKHLGKKTVLNIGNVIMIVGSLMTVFGYDHLTMIFAAAAIRGLASGFGQIILWGMFPDIADYGEWKTGIKSPAIIYSGATFGIKCCGGLSNGLMGVLLSVIGYNTAPELAGDGLRLIFGWAPAIGSVLCIIAVLFYKLEGDTLQRVKDNLEVRRKAGAEDGVTAV